MLNFQPTLRLIRFYAPAGTLLLMFPPLWALVLLSRGLPELSIIAAFILGAFLMRSSGCIINDLTDRKLDAKVERTKNRPLASGEISNKYAIALLLLLLTCAAIIALFLGTKVFLTALGALPLIAAYPWMKRITFWPQLFLGITFNYGVILASIAVLGWVHPAAILIYLGTILWTLGYDTIYGYQDIADDELIGVKSTSRLFGTQPKPSLAAIYTGALACWTLAGYALEQGVGYYALICFVAVHSMWQITSLDIRQPEICKKLFTSNAWLGAGMLVILIVIPA